MWRMTRFGVHSEACQVKPKSVNKINHFYSLVQKHIPSIVNVLLHKNYKLWWFMKTVNIKVRLQNAKMQKNRCYIFYIQYMTLPHILRDQTHVPKGLFCNLRWFQKIYLIIHSSNKKKYFKNHRVQKCKQRKTPTSLDFA